MKSKLLFTALLATGLVISFTSCKKTSTATEEPEIATTRELTGDQAISDNLTEETGEITMDAIEERGLAGERPADALQTSGILSCATITATPLVGFPKTIVIDFGTTGCLGPNGIFRRGKINVVLSDTLRRPGATAVTTFDNYFVNGFQKEGTITWLNTSTPGVRSWRRTMQNGKITAPNGRFWTHFGTKDVVQTAGVNTPRNLIDDVFSITGGHTVTNANGVARTSTILTPLQKKTACANIDQGTVRVQGPNHYAILDYGDGTCDRIATISINGNTPVTFLLR